MKEDYPVIKYMHYQIDTKRFLSVATHLNREDNTLTLGYTVSSPKDIYDRKSGNHIAYAKMKLEPIIVNIPDSSLIFHRFMAWYSLEHIFIDMLKYKKYPDKVMEKLETLCDNLLEELMVFLTRYFYNAFNELRNTLFLDNF